MMTFDAGQGALFQNEKKQGKQPDYRGEGKCPNCTNGFEIAGWKRTAKASGKTFLSLKLQPPRTGGQEFRRDSEDDDGAPF
jgi:uncharacterized protein (DUF736 family)